MSVIVYLFLVCMFWETSTAASSCQITKIAENTSANAVSLTWSLGDCVSKVDYVFVEVNHTSWRACFNKSSDRTEGAGHQVFNVSYTRIDISRLYPYSTYSAVLKAMKGESVLGEGQIDFTTDSDVPDIKPKTKLQGESDTYKHTIRFFWDDPSPQDCIYQNGRKDGYWVELRGADPWVTEPLIIRNQSVTGNEFYVGDLMPYTSYKLRVYSKNVGDLINQNVYLVLQERTKPSIPSLPVNLSSSTISESSIYLSWKPAYPPTGLIQEYRVRQGAFLPGSDVAWSKEISVDTGHHTACTSQSHRNEGYVCYVVNDLQPSTTYVFQVQTVNKDVDSPSDWSRSTTSETASPILVPTEVSPSQVKEETTPTSLVHPTETGDNTALVIVLCLVVAAVILGIVSAFLVYKFKLDKLKERLRMEHSISLSRLESSYGPGSISTQGTNYTVSPASIQNRRLPEPPPDQVSVQQFQYPGYLDMSTASRRNSRSARSMNNQMLDSEDMDGYLKPTFPQTDLSSRPVADDRFSTIPTESYGTTTSSQHWETSRDVTSVRPDLLPPGNIDRSSPASLNSSNSHNQLIISKSVDI